MTSQLIDTIGGRKHKYGGLDLLTLATARRKNTPASTIQFTPSSRDTEISTSSSCRYH